MGMMNLDIHDGSTSIFSKPISSSSHALFSPLNHTLHRDWAHCEVTHYDNCSKAPACCSVLVSGDISSRSTKCAHYLHEYTTDLDKATICLKQHSDDDDSGSQLEAWDQLSQDS